MTAISLQSGRWYQDKPLQLDFPDHWQISTHWPATPEPLSETDIETGLDQPVGCPPLRQALKDKSNVVIVVDDLTRPTPAHRILPLLLARMRAASNDVRISIVIATGTHGHQDERALRSKLGEEAWDSCTIKIHNDLKDAKRIGYTSYRTPVYVNRSVLDADFCIGVGGVYPQYTTGFGGGGKLALGVCGRQTIFDLHSKHKSMEGLYITENDFRKDVTEIAAMIGLDTIVNLHIDAFSNVVRVVYGDHREYYEAAARFSKDNYTAPVAGNADLVVANAYPLDTSFTFMRKGYKPLYTAPRSAVKVIIAGAHEGIGVHGIYQYIDPSRLAAIRNLLTRALSMDKRVMMQKVRNRVIALFRPTLSESTTEEKTTILPPNTDHLYVLRTDASGASIPEMDDVTVRSDWGELLAIIQREHFSDRQNVSAAVYTCAPIQCVDEQ